MQAYVPEKTTNQLAVWWSLIDTLERLEATWLAAQPTGPETPASSQLPANVTTALAQAGERGTRVLAGMAAVLADQLDSGGTFRQLALAQQQLAEKWRART